MTQHPLLTERLRAIDPRAYARSRNYLDGAVTRLSPFISRGALSTRAVFDQLAAHGRGWDACEKLVQELSWRDYFQRVWQAKGTLIDTDLKRSQEGVRHRELPRALPSAATGIGAVDAGVTDLMATGYLHNHLRMYTAAVACNVGGAHWLAPAKWMYYHLHDGDWASNALSWQWVAGAFSSKKYLANQENINRYTGSRQRGTFLDAEYSDLESAPVPPSLEATEPFDAVTPLPVTAPPVLRRDRVFVYSYYNLDAQWHAGDDGDRVLLLEPDVFARYPVSQSCVDWALELGACIPGLQVMVGAFDDLAGLAGDRALYIREHPLNAHWRGVAEPREWMLPDLDGYFPSFFAYWKKAEPRLRAQFLSPRRSGEPMTSAEF